MISKEIKRDAKIHLKSIAEWLAIAAVGWIIRIMLAVIIEGGAL
jgi:hypothetical protein